MTELLLEAKTYSEETEYPLPRDKGSRIWAAISNNIEEGYLANPLNLIKKWFHHKSNDKWF